MRNFVQTRPLIYKDKVNFGSWGNDFYALDANTGKMLWRKHDKQEWVRESMGLSTDSNLVYVKNMQGHILGLNTHASDQEVIWRSPLEMGYEICPTAINEFNNVVFIPSQSGVISALAAKDGAILWRYKISNCLLNNIKPVDEHTVLTCSADGKLACLTF